MEKSMLDDTWTRSGISLLWDTSSLSKIAKATEILSMRQFFQMAGSGWPQDLPCSGGSALVVAGLDACLDALSPEEAVEWLEQELYQVLLSFQEEYERQAALIFWLPEAVSRLEYQTSEETYLWRCAGEYKESRIALSRGLWNGAEKDVRRILCRDHRQPASKSDGWTGLYHPRIS